LGIVSSHIRRHSVWDVVLKGLISHIDKQAFELTVYHLGFAEDAETQFAKARVHRWRDVSTLEGGLAWAELIAADELDVLFYPELGMDPASYMLAQQRLAPLQAVGWGHPITTGIEAIDLFFSGELLEPEGAQDHYRERLIQLPSTGCCTSAYEVEVQPSVIVEELRAATAGPLFLIPQSVVKFDPVFDPVFVEIAQRLGECCFVIPVADTMEEAGDLLAARLAGAFSKVGLDPAAFLRFVPWLSEGEFRHALQVCNVFLDCPSFSGYTTAWKALREGIPVLTWDGPYMRQRLAAGLLKKVGLHEGVAASIPDYIDKAVALAQEPRQDGQVRRQRIASAAPLADNDLSVVRAFEQVLQRHIHQGAAHAQPGSRA
jgi:protein O-GlcNAc transferase